MDSWTTRCIPANHCLLSLTTCGMSSRRRKQERKQIKATEAACYLNANSSIYRVLQYLSLNRLCHRSPAFIFLQSVVSLSRKHYKGKSIVAINILGISSNSYKHWIVTYWPYQNMGPMAKPVENHWSSPFAKWINIVRMFLLTFEVFSFSLSIME